MSQSGQWDQVQYKILSHTGNWLSSCWGGSSLISLTDRNTAFSMSSGCCEFAWLLQRTLLMHKGECAFPSSCSAFSWAVPPPTNCANRLLLPEMLTMDVHWATTRSCKKSCLLAVSSGKCQVLISYSARKESTLLSYDIAKKRNKLLARNTDWTCQKGTKWLHNVYGYYTTWQVTINKLGLGIPPAESKSMHLMSVLTTRQGKDCWSCSTGIDSIRSLTDECFL